MRKIAIIPARAGSKSITKKNLLLFRGKPLFYWSLKVAIEADIFDKIYLSTDCDEIIRYSRNLSIDIIKRPSEICKDRSRDIEYLKNLINHIDFEDYTISILIKKKRGYSRM